MHFRHISAKIQPKNLKLVYNLFLAVRDDIRLVEVPGPPWLCPYLFTSTHLIRNNKLAHTK